MPDFTWSEQREPHFSRRKAILAQHPEVKNLYGIDKSLKFKSLIPLLIQIAVPFILPENNIWIWVLAVLLIGTTMTHIIVLAIHEITHDLAFEKKVLNNWFSMLINFPLLFPFAMTFKQYHAEHHWYQGKNVIDTDLASNWEARLFRGFFGKFFWLLFQILFYGLRPLLTHPIKPDKWQVINLLTQLAFVSVYFLLTGWWGIGYLFFSLVLASGIHPLSGHFIAEHYLFVPEQETYSYYGPLNKLVFNVGYHNEHHDFPNIPGDRLPELKKIASGYYDNLYSHQSWTRVIWRFLTDARLNLFSRVKRLQ